MFKLEKYYGVYEDKNKNYIRTDFYSKEEAIEAFDNSDNKETMLGHINSYLKDIICDNESILCFRYINYDVQIDLELLKDKDGFKIIEKR